MKWILFLPETQRLSVDACLLKPQRRENSDDSRSDPTASSAKGRAQAAAPFRLAQNQMLQQASPRLFLLSLLGALLLIN